LSADPLAVSYDQRSRKWLIPRDAIPAAARVAARDVAETVSQPPHMDGLCALIDGPEVRGAVVTFVGPGKAFCEVRADYVARPIRLERGDGGLYLSRDGWRADFTTALSNILDYKRYFSLAELRAGPMIAFDVRTLLPTDWDVDARPSRALH